VNISQHPSPQTPPTRDLTPPRHMLTPPEEMKDADPHPTPPTPPIRDLTPHRHMLTQPEEMKDAVHELRLRPQEQIHFASYVQPRSVPAAKGRINNEEKNALADKIRLAGKGMSQEIPAKCLIHGLLFTLPLNTISSLTKYM
jgi:signal recognition particle subunit SEC65